MQLVCVWWGGCAPQRSPHTRSVSTSACHGTSHTECTVCMRLPSGRAHYRSGGSTKGTIARARERSMEHCFTQISGAPHPRVPGFPLLSAYENIEQCMRILFGVLGWERVVYLRQLKADKEMDARAELWVLLEYSGMFYLEVNKGFCMKQF